MNATFFGFALLAALNPKFLGADLLLIENRRPRAMYFAFLGAAFGLAATIGLLDVLVLHADTIQTQGSISATADLVLGSALLAAGGLLATGRPRKAPGKERKPSGQSWADRALGQPRLGLAVLVGLVAGVPGAAYLAGLKHLVTGGSPIGTQVVAVLVFDLIMYALIIVPLGFLLARPEATAVRVRRINAWLTGHLRQLVAAVALAVGAYMAISGLTRLLG
jgi:Sap, sulfolipid-1-addressing protein